MASLFTQLQKRDLKCDTPESRVTRVCAASRRDGVPIPLVDINQWAKRSQQYYEAFPDESIDATPCRPFMWLEYIQLPQSFRTGIYVTRESSESEWVRKIAELHKTQKIPDKTAHYVLATFIQERFGVVEEIGDASVFVDAMGRILDAKIFRLRGEDGDEHCEADRNWATLQFCITLEVLTIMNTRGTRIEPPLDHLPAEIVKPNRPPHSVWHTIHLPRFKAPAREDAVIDGPVLEKREHWVRAHRKDYRDGKGLFGRIKALVWVPEYQRGNPELGSVMQSYRVEDPHGGLR